jgi:hypothetical protein
MVFFRDIGVGRHDLTPQNSTIHGNSYPAEVIIFLNNVTNSMNTRNSINQKLLFTWSETDCQREWLVNSMGLWYAIKIEK